MRRRSFLSTVLGGLVALGSGPLMTRRLPSPPQYIYCPYIPLQISRVNLNRDSFTLSGASIERYSRASLNNSYYRKVIL